MPTKEEYVQLLQSTGREGIEPVLSYLDKAGFFSSAPASAKRHLNYEGGLMEHSMNVCRVALALREQMVALKPELAEKLSEESIIISALLHDVCKTTLYRKVQKYRKDEYGRWETYDAYESDSSRFPVGHGEKSVIMLLQLGLKLKKEEIVAIRWHMGAWDLSFQSFEQKTNISEANDRFPLASLLQAADSLSTHLLENDTPNPNPEKK